MKQAREAASDSTLTNAIAVADRRAEQNAKVEKMWSNELDLLHSGIEVAVAMAPDSLQTTSSNSQNSEDAQPAIEA